MKILKYILLFFIVIFGAFVVAAIAPQPPQQKEAPSNETATATQEVAPVIQQIPLQKGSKAEKLCTKHKDWENNDCFRVASRKIWIGMTYGMLLEVAGKPSHISPSNYMGEEDYQFCWYEHSPSCFYSKGDDLDSIIYAYN